MQIFLAISAARAMKQLNVSILFLACLAILLIKSSVQQNEYLYRGSDSRHANFLQHPRVFLDVSPMAIKKVLDALYCSLQCLRNARCLSFNFKVKPDAGNKYDCQLLDTDKYNSTNNLKSSKEFNHHSLLTPCEASPCRNGGTCYPVYDEQHFKCVCAAGFTGTNCEVANAGGQLILPGSMILDGNPDYNEKLTNFLKPVQVSGKQWKLCFRASEHDFKATAFHTECDNKGATVTLVRVEDNVFGGYADESWNGDVGAIPGTAAFIFSLKNKANKQLKMLLYKDKGRAIESKKDMGPKFNNDIAIDDSCNSNIQSKSDLGGAYKLPPGYNEGSTEAKEFLAGSYTFKCDEYEVFYR